jgi:hypothetical protein
MDPLRRLGLPVWSARHHHIRQGWPSARPPCGRACAVCSTSNIHPRQPTILNPTGW